MRSIRVNIRDQVHPRLHVITWDDEPREKIKKLLKLDNYNGSNYAALYPWCIISEQPVDWSVETNIRTRKRRRL